MEAVRGYTGSNMRIAPDPLTPAVEDTTPISKRLRVTLWLIAWVLVVIGIASFTPQLIPVILLYFFLFPMGLAAPIGASDWDSSVATFGTLIVGWSLYIALSVFGLKQQRRVRYFWIYVILIALLVLNAAGCRYEIAHMKINC